MKQGTEFIKKKLKNKNIKKKIFVQYKLNLLGICSMLHFFCFSLFSFFKITLLSYKRRLYCLFCTLFLFIWLFLFAQICLKILYFFCYIFYTFEPASKWCFVFSYIFNIFLFYYFLSVVLDHFIHSASSDQLNC